MGRVMRTEFQICQRLILTLCELSSSLVTAVNSIGRSHLRRLDARAFPCADEIVLSHHGPRDGFFAASNGQV